MEIEKLFELAKTPEPCKEGTHEIWLDPDRADLVLESHIDEDITGGSKESCIIEETLNVTNKIAAPNKYKNVVELACGPGLYPQKLAMKGYDVVGIGFK